MSGPKALSLRPRKNRVDYRTLGNSGRRVITETSALIKTRSSQNPTDTLNMELQRLVDEEKRI